MEIYFITKSYSTLRDDPGAVLLPPEVRADDEGLAAALPRRGRQVVRVPPRDGHRGALPREVDCRGGADAGAGAGDDGDLARQGTHHTSSFMKKGVSSSKQFSYSPLCTVTADHRRSTLSNKSISSGELLSTQTCVDTRLSKILPPYSY